MIYLHVDFVDKNFKRVKKILQNKEIYRFLVVGLSTFLIDAGLYHILFHFYNFTLVLYPTNIYIASIISAVIAVLVNYLFQNIWVFEVRKVKNPKYFSKFIATHVFNIIVFQGFMVGIIHPLVYHAFVAKFIVIFFQTMFSFLMYKYVVFEKK